MIIRKANLSDHDRIMEIYRIAQDYMIASGNPNQWRHEYPSAELISSDIREGLCHVICEGEHIHGVFAMLREPEPTYQYIEGGAWVNEDPYITIHRVASDGEVHGIVRTVMDYAKGLTDNVRIDTHADNMTMQRQLEKNGFSECGTIYLEDRSSRIAYQWTKGKNCISHSGWQYFCTPVSLILKI